jgi:hypothetical protein
MRSYGGTDFGSDEVVGVLAGYYFGAGLMVKPSVVEGVGRATAQLAGRCESGVSVGKGRGNGTVRKHGAADVHLEHYEWGELSEGE